MEAKRVPRGRRSLAPSDRFPSSIGSPRAPRPLVGGEELVGGHVIELVNVREALSSESRFARQPPLAPVKSSRLTPRSMFARRSLSDLASATRGEVASGQEDQPERLT